MPGSRPVQDTTLQMLMRNEPAFKAFTKCRNISLRTFCDLNLSRPRTAGLTVRLPIQEGTAATKLNRDGLARGQFRNEVSGRATRWPSWRRSVFTLVFLPLSRMRSIAQREVLA
jgi:hypothetical protein